MLPYIHIGGIAFATYGILLGTGLIAGYYVFRAELLRRQLDAAWALWWMAGLSACGLVGARLALALAEPALYLRQPELLFSRLGFVYYGGLAGEMLGAVVLARMARIPALSLLDALSVPWIVGYGIGRIGCLLAGDGCYGIPTDLPWGMSFPGGVEPTLQHVHPTPLYEFLSSAIIAGYLWRLGSPAWVRAVPSGMVWAQFLIWTGLARLLVEIVKRNPAQLLGLSAAQLVALASIAGGTLLWWRLQSQLPASAAALKRSM